MLHLLRTSTLIRQPIDEVFSFFADAANLGRITPPELCFRILSPLPIEIKENTLIEYRIKLHGVAFRWTSRICLWDPPLRFQDVQIRGPYLQWVHTHDFTEEINSTRITDRVAYRLPCGWIGELFHPFIRRKLERIFDYRKKAVHEILGSLHRTGHS